MTIVIELAVGLVLVLTLALIIRRTLFADDPVDRMYWRTRARLRPGKGFASIWEVSFHHSRWAAVLHGKRARPSMSFRYRLTSPATEYSIRHGRAQYGRRIYSRAEDQGLYWAPPRQGKTGTLGERVICHPGPGICAESRSDVYYATVSHRQALGPVEVFNPKHVSGIPSTFKWAITQGCEDPTEALLRATDLVGAIAEGEMQWWSEKSATALAAALHAAAVLGADMADVWAWSNGFAPEIITEGRKAAGASIELFGALAELDRPGKTADSIRLTMSKSLAWLAVPEIRNMVTGPDAKPFDVPRFIDSRGTIYMMAGGDGDPCAPLFRCFTSYVHRNAGLYGLSTWSRKLDPGLLVAIDELHACPVDLPAWLADSAGKGIQVCAVVHSVGQLVKKYGEDGMRTVWDTTGTKLILPGVQDAETLESLSKLCGHYQDDKLFPKVPVEFLRRLPNGFGLLLRGNRPPVVIKLRPHWKHRQVPARVLSFPGNHREVTEVAAPEIETPAMAGAGADDAA